MVFAHLKRLDLPTRRTTPVFSVAHPPSYPRLKVTHKGRQLCFDLTELDLNKGTLRITPRILEPGLPALTEVELAQNATKLDKTKKLSVETIGSKETKLWAYASIVASVGAIVWGIAASTMGVIPILVFSLVTLVNLVYQTTRLCEASYDQKFPPLTDKEREMACSPGAPSVAILIPALHEPPAMLEMTLWAAALQEYSNKEVVLLNDNEPTDQVQQRETEQLNEIISRMNSLLGAGRKFIAGLKGSCRAVGERNLKAELLALSSGAEYIANLLRQIDARFGSYKDLTDTVTRQRVFLGRAKHFQEIAQKCREMAGSAEVTISRIELDKLWREMGIVFKVRIGSFARKSFANLPKTKNKATNLNAYLSLEGGRWVVGRNAKGEKVILDPSSPAATELSQQRRVKVDRHDYFLIIDSDNRVFPEYLQEAIPFMEREKSQEVSIFQSPTWSLPSDNPVQHIVAYEMNMSGLLEKGFAVLDNACWAGSSGVLRRRVFEAIQEKPQAPETSPYRKTIQDETVIEDFETDLHIKINNPNSKTVYSRKPMCALINPDNWGDVEIQRERWSNGPYILLKKLLKAGRHLSNKMFMIRAYRYLSYSVNMIVTLGILFKAASFAGNPFTYLYLLAGFLSYFRPLQKRGFSFKDSQLEIICNLFLLPTYLKGHISTIRQMITGKKIPFARTPKDGSRSRISLATAAFVIGSFGYLIGGVGPDLFQLVVNGKLTVNAMQLYTTALMGAAIFKFIGYQTLFKDFAFQVREKYRRLVSS